MPNSASSDAKILAEQKENLKKTDCSMLRSDSINGEAATVFQVINSDAGSRVLAWISPAGLLLRLHLTISSGAKIMSTRSATYDYQNVQLPAGAK